MDTKEEDKKRVLDELQFMLLDQPDYKIRVEGTVFGPGDLIDAIEGDLELGNNAVSVLAEIDFSPSRNALGKRRFCCICGTELLCTKAGDGNVSHCGQPMAAKVPRPIPSSD